MDGLDDLSLITLARDGDKSAEDALVLRYKTYVEMLARPYFLAGAEQDDIIQIGMIGLLKAIRNYASDKEGTFKTYATRCIRNAILDGVREANAKKNMPLNKSYPLLERSEDSDGAAYSHFTLSSEPDPEEQYIAKEAEQAFFDALSHSLGETDLAIIKLYLSSMPYKEISEQLGVTAKKVDNTIYNAKKKIEKMLKDYKK